MREIIVIAENVRSIHNVGSLLRTAEGLGCTKVYLTGYTPYPQQNNDQRLPHQSEKLTRQINKTALGAEKIAIYQPDINAVIKNLRKDGYSIIALEQSETSVDINSFNPPDKCALIVGNEVKGVSKETIKQSDTVLEIPMFGNKESFNVVQSAAMALFYLRFK